MQEAHKQDPAPQIEVYDGTSIRIFPAPLGKRVLALAVDYAIVGSCMYVAFIVLGILIGGVAGFVAALAQRWAATLSGSEKAVAGIIFLLVAAIVIILSFAMMHAYFIYYEYKKGATPGKKIFGLQVISIEGGRLSLRQCVLRELFRSLLEVPLIVPGLISVIVTNDRRRIGDFVAGTVVVHSDRAEQNQESTFLPLEYYDDLLHRLEPRALDESKARQFLRFCNDRFLGATPSEDAGELARWAHVVRQQVGPEASELDDQSVVLFYAEFLYRTLK